MSKRNTKLVLHKRKKGSHRNRKKIAVQGEVKQKEGDNMLYKNEQAEINAQITFNQHENRETVLPEQNECERNECASLSELDDRSVILDTTDESCGHSMSVIKFLSDNGEELYGIVDCGMMMPQETRDKNVISRVSEINRKLPVNDDEICKIKFILITHSHDDHCGLIPYIVHKGYDGPIYMTEVCKEEMPLILSDCNNISRKEGFVLYNDKDVSKALSLMQSIKYDRIFTAYYDRKIRILVNANFSAHLEGACSYLIQFWFNEESLPANIVFSGDIKVHNEFIIDRFLQTWVSNLPVTIVCESTYGGTFSNQVRTDCFEENVANIYNRGGNVVIASIANERVEILLHRLYLMKVNGMIPYDTKIYVKGWLAQNLFYIIRMNRDKIGIPRNYTFDFREIEFMTGKDITPPGNYIMIATPGMLKAGSSLKAAIKESQNPLSGLILTSYVPPTGIAKKFLTIPKGEEIVLPSGERICKKFDVFQYTGISGHCKADEIKKYFLDEFNAKLSVILNHGDRENQEKFKSYLINEYNGNVPVYIASRKKAFRISSNGVEEVLFSDINN